MTKEKPIYGTDELGQMEIIGFEDEKEEENDN